MSKPRNLYSGTTVFVTCRCVHQSYRLVPTAVVRRVVDYCFAVISMRYRLRYGMKFYEFEFLESHYHLVACNACGRITDFLQDLNALIARELNAVRGRSERSSTASRASRPCSARTRSSSTASTPSPTPSPRASSAPPSSGRARTPGGSSTARSMRSPGRGWGVVQEGSAQASAQLAAFGAGGLRPAVHPPETAVLMLDRPPIMPELSDAQLRARIRGALEVREEEVAKKRAGKPVLGMKAGAEDSLVDAFRGDGEESSGLNPTLSTETLEQRIVMKGVLRKRSFANTRRRSPGGTRASGMWSSSGHGSDAAAAHRGDRAIAPVRAA